MRCSWPDKQCCAHTGISGGIQEALSPPGNPQENPGRNELSALCSGAPRAEHLAKAQLDTKPGQQGSDVLDPAAQKLPGSCRAQAGTEQTAPLPKVLPDSGSNSLLQGGEVPTWLCLIQRGRFSDLAEKILNPHVSPSQTLP